MDQKCFVLDNVPAVSLLCHRKVHMELSTSQVMPLPSTQRWLYVCSAGVSLSIQWYHIRPFKHPVISRDNNYHLAYHSKFVKHPSGLNNIIVWQDRLHSFLQLSWCYK